MGNREPVHEPLADGEALGWLKAAVAPYSNDEGSVQVPLAIARGVVAEIERLRAIIFDRAVPIIAAEPPQPERWEVISKSGWSVRADAAEPGLQPFAATTSSGTATIWFRRRVPA